MTVARGGRLTETTSLAMQAVNASIDVDSRLCREGIRRWMAPAQGLARAGVISQEEALELTRGLEQVALEIESGKLVWDPVKEDVHMNIEARLTEIVGPVGGKLHTGRSRNDQVATDLRLWVRGNARE